MLVGGALSLAALSSPALVVSVLAVTLGVAAVSWRLGRAAGERIALRGYRQALGYGAAGGLAAVLAAATLAGGVGLLWGIGGSGRARGFFWDFVGKPFVTVLLSGSWIAALLGGLAGVVILALYRRNP